MKSLKYISVIWVSLTISNLFASEIVHKFKSPSFSGIGTSSHYLTIENQENSRSKEIEEEQQALIEKKLKQVSLEPTGYIKKDTNTFLSNDEIEEIEQGLEKLTQESFQSTSVETTTGGGFTTTYEDGTVVRTAEDGTETVISGPTA